MFSFIFRSISCDNIWNTNTDSGSSFIFNTLVRLFHFKGLLQSSKTHINGNFFKFLLQNLRLWNNTLSYHYWQRPGVIRLTKVYIFNVTNPDGFLNGEKPKLVEVGPFVYRFV